MERRFLGNSGFCVPVVGFGTMTFGASGFFAGIGKTEVKDAQNQIDFCLDMGVDLFDTADIYSEGASETVLGEALGKKRNQALIATKAYGRMGSGAHDIGLSRQHLIAACEASLKRLKTDYIDLYQLHFWDSKVPLEETMRALDDLVRSGKVRYIGCSNFYGWQLAKAMGISEKNGYEKLISQQIQYSLLVRDAETEMLPSGIDFGVGALIWSPLAQGYLSGKFRSADQSGSRLKNYNELSRLDTEKSRKIVDALFDIAANYEGATPTQVALNWTLSRQGVSSVIVGARTNEQLKDSFGTNNFKLSPEEIKILDDLSANPTLYPKEHFLRFHPERNPQIF